MDNIKETFNETKETKVMANETTDNSLAIFQGTGKTWTTLKAETIEDKKKIYNASKKCDVFLKDIKGQEIEINDAYITEYTKKDLDENGNPRIGHKTILFGTDGKTYVTCSNYFFNSFAQILSAYNGQITEAIKIKIVGVQTKGAGEALGCEWL
jgi:hypothetical protein